MTKRKTRTGRLEGEEVYVRREGHSIVLTPKDSRRGR
jgi:hypothetical protein